MKKVLIVAVCLALALTLAFILGALGEKPDKPEKPGKPEHVIYELTFEKGLDVTGTKESPVVEQCSVQGGFISSSNYEELRPNLCLGEIFGDYKICTEKYDGRYLDLSEHKGEISMQFFFLFEDLVTEEKGEIQLNVEGGYIDEVYGDGEWLSEKFKIVFDDLDNAVILPTKGKRDPLWGPGNVSITIVCKGE